MLAPTHMVFGSSLTLIVLAVFGLSSSLHWAIILFAIIGSLLPDIDLPKSSVGRCFPSLSKWIERQYGHRNMTHSLVAWLVVSVVMTLLLMVIGLLMGIESGFQGRLASAFSIGYLSHLILDMFNPTGVALLWPHPGRDVAIGNPSYRPASGSKAERIIFAGFCLLFIFSLPLSEYGLTHSLRWLLATPSGAIQQFHEMSTHSYVDFEGLHNQTKQRMAGRAELLGVQNKLLHIYYNRQFWTLGDDHNADIAASTVRVYSTETPLTITTQTIHNQSRAEILDSVPSGNLISGSITLPKELTLVLPNTNTLHQSGRLLTLTYAKKADLQSLTLPASYHHKNAKSQAKLTQLQAKRQRIYAQYLALDQDDGLTAEGRALLLTDSEKTARSIQKSQLQATLSTLDLSIEEQHQHINDQALVFSGTLIFRPIHLAPLSLSELTLTSLDGIQNKLIQELKMIQDLQSTDWLRQSHKGVSQ